MTAPSITRNLLQHLWRQLHLTEPLPTMSHTTWHKACLPLIDHKRMKGVGEGGEGAEGVAGVEEDDDHAHFRTYAHQLLCSQLLWLLPTPLLHLVSHYVPLKKSSVKVV